jgi:hypothetical protein
MRVRYLGGGIAAADPEPVNGGADRDANPGLRYAEPVIDSVDANSHPALSPIPRRPERLAPSLRGRNDVLDTLDLSDTGRLAGRA